MKQNGQTTAHTMITEMEISDADFVFKVNTEDILLDLKFLIKEYYCGTFTNDRKSLIMQFNNGQKFILDLKEITKE